MASCSQLRELEVHATLQAAVAAIEIVETLPVSPVVIRVHPVAALHVAGMRTPPGGGDALVRALRLAWTRVAATRPIWLAGWQRYQVYWWGDRAATLAAQLVPNRVANAPGPYVWGGVYLPAWRQVFSDLPALDGVGDDCPVCLSIYDDPLPRPPTNAQVSRAMTSVFTCV